jgi:hypothetical protein
MKKRKSPQQKKSESYTHDSRNLGSDPKGARKSIPRSKARSHRAFRRLSRQALREADPLLLETRLGVSPERRLADSREQLRRFKKSPDSALATQLTRRHLFRDPDSGRMLYRAGPTSRGVALTETALADDELRELSPALLLVALGNNVMEARAVLQSLGNRVAAHIAYLQRALGRKQKSPLGASSAKGTAKSHR